MAPRANWKGYPPMARPLTANAFTMASYPSQWPINADILDMLVRPNWLGEAESQRPHSNRRSYRAAVGWRRITGRSAIPLERRKNSEQHRA